MDRKILSELVPSLLRQMEEVIRLWMIFFRLYSKIVIFIIVVYLLIILVVFFFILIPLGLMNFSNEGLKRDNIDFIHQLIGYSLTLSGFTLLGGIFEKDKPKKIELKLFISSLGFLLTAFLFIIFIALVAMPEKMTQADADYAWLATYGALFTFCLALFFFVAGFVFLLYTLLGYAKELLRTN